jgi:hypothetical protein
LTFPFFFPPVFFGKLPCNSALFCFLFIASLLFFPAPLFYSTFLGSLFLSFLLQPFLLEPFLLAPFLLAPLLFPS